MKLVDREAVIEKLVYTATNPVQDHLVDRVHHWPGVNGLTALLAGRPLRATRPLHFFRPDGPMPDALELPLTVPAELGPVTAVLSELRDRVRHRARARGRARAHPASCAGATRGARVVVARIPSERGAPAEPPTLGRVAKQVGAHRGAAAQSAFVIEYASARVRWQNGMAAVFPSGTYWLQRFASVPVLET